MKIQKGTTIILLMTIMLSITVLISSFAVTITFKNQSSMKYINQLKARYLAFSITRTYASILYRNIPEGSDIAPPEKLTPMTFTNIALDDTTDSKREVTDSTVKVTSKTMLNKIEKTMVMEFYGEEGLINAYGLEYGTFPESKLPVTKVE